MSGKIGRREMLAGFLGLTSMALTGCSEQSSEKEILLNRTFNEANYQLRKSAFDLLTKTHALNKEEFINLVKNQQDLAIRLAAFDLMIGRVNLNKEEFLDLAYNQQDSEVKNKVFLILVGKNVLSQSELKGFAKYNEDREIQQNASELYLINHGSVTNFSDKDTYPSSPKSSMDCNYRVPPEMDLLAKIGAGITIIAIGTKYAILKITEKK